MAIIKEVRGHVPVVGEGTFLAETAVLIGDVTVGRDCSIWYGAVLRGDVNSIRIGDRTNIQDGAVVHTLYDGAPHPSQAHIGSDVSIGHNAIIHGAVIEDGCLIGMGATVLDNAVDGLYRGRQRAGAGREPAGARRGICRGTGTAGEGGDAAAAAGDYRTYGPRLYAVRVVVRGGGRVNAGDGVIALPYSRFLRYGLFAGQRPGLQFNRRFFRFGSLRVGRPVGLLYICNGFLPR